MVKNYYTLLTLISDYFSGYSQDELKKELFPHYADLFSEIAEHRGYGIPKAYKNAVLSHSVNKKMFFFESNLGKQYTGNPRYIYERMIERFPDFMYVWCYEGSNEIPGNPIVVNRGTAEYYKYLAQSGFIINNTTFPLWYHRPESFYLQTWHGTPFKRLHWDITSRPMERRSSPEFYVKSKGWNALLSPNRYSTEIFRTAFRYDGEILEFGYPANDIFYHRDRYNQVRRNIRAKLGIHDENTPVYLYAPTWRDGKHLGNYMFKFDLLLNIDEFIEHAPKDAILLIRSHHMSYSTEELKGLTGRVKNVSEWDDAIELMCASDVLITDYSSIVFDWYCSRKPVIYYVPDYDEYVHNLRGAYFDLNEVNAGEICRTQDELFKILKKVVKKKPVFHKDFYNKFCYLHDGKSADKVIDYLLLK